MWGPMGGWEFLCYWITLLNKRMLGLEMLNPKAQTLNPKPKVTGPPGNGSHDSKIVQAHLPEGEGGGLGCGF